MSVKGTVMQDFGSNEESLQHRLKNILESGHHSDVVLKVGHQSFPAHKLILSLRSPVFDAMFSHEMPESQTNEVHITDCDPEIFQVFLRYMYTGSCGTIEQPLALYTVADRYGLQILKFECTAAFASTFTPENAIDKLIEAHENFCELPKQRALQFICSTKSTALKMKDASRIENLIDSHPQLLKEFIGQYLNLISE